MPRHAPVPGDGLPRAPRTHGPAGASGCSKFEVVPATRSPQTPRTTSHPKRDRIRTNRIESALKRPQQVAGDRRPALAVRKFRCERSRGRPGGTSRGHRKRSTRYRRVRRQAREPARPAVEAQHAPHIPGSRRRLHGSVPPPRRGGTGESRPAEPVSSSAGRRHQQSRTRRSHRVQGSWRQTLCRELRKYAFYLLILTIAKNQALLPTPWPAGTRRVEPSGRR